MARTAETCQKMHWKESLAVHN